MRSTGDAQKLSNASSSSSPFQLFGGYYELAGVATWGGGSLTLQQLGPDRSTYLNTAATLSANGIAYAYVPAGTFKLTIATATGVYATLVRVPVEG